MRNKMKKEKGRGRRRGRRHCTGVRCVAEVASPPRQAGRLQDAQAASVQRPFLSLAERPGWSGGHQRSPVGWRRKGCTWGCSRRRRRGSRLCALQVGGCCGRGSGRGQRGSGGGGGGRGARRHRSRGRSSACRSCLRRRPLRTAGGELRLTCSVRERYEHSRPESGQPSLGRTPRCAAHRRRPVSGRRRRRRVGCGRRVLDEVRRRRPAMDTVVVGKAVRVTAVAWAVVAGRGGDGR